MNEESVSMMASGPPETVLPPESERARHALESALSLPLNEQRDAVAGVVAQWPKYLEAWARLGDLARDPVEAYSAYRVGYHRGLDRLRQSGWRGSGFVRWREKNNRGFLLALSGLARVAGEIGEQEEQERCELFLYQLDPEWQPGDVT